MIILTCPDGGDRPLLEVGATVDAQFAGVILVVLSASSIVR